ncbi:ABC transporter transmembrane region protein (macronuclear) [Tetrahymena thermophila SB210]|uniref:ABC transporter transmembrane region protein n=1 Tax=Tetrahymena thermophila (strain SB210) TaxID=312017 RepID=Q235E3_TETTS|nr:ABC transporter transmembrane region protein [Tetrahymena thermophila SB210]EAR92160.3 ABC transporter transmembrane region protein [Tetrahymena thermophila SB210]|eukprot:XP_001012405.3 ABC transporter transmembrane region protein [Tetrahymena thermophila SB210]
MPVDKAEKRRLKKIREFQKIDEQILKAVPYKVLQSQITQDLKIGFFRLFRFSSKDDKIMMIFGTLAAIVNGGCIPLFSYLYGEVRDAMITAIQKNKSQNSEITNVSVFFLIIAAVCFVAAFIQQYCWAVAGTSQSIKIRIEYYHSLFRQDMSWYFKEDKLKLVNRIQTELFSITDGIAEKVGYLILIISIGVSSLIQSFLTHISMSLILVVTIPLLAYPFYHYEKTERLMEQQRQEDKSQAGKIFDQSVQHIQSIKSYNKQDIIFEKYEEHIMEAKSKNIKSGIKLGVSLGITVFALFLQNALILLIGSLMVKNNFRNAMSGRATDLSDVLIVFICLLICGIVFGQLSPLLNMITRARHAGGRVFSTIDAIQNINPQNKIGKEIGDLKGHIQFQNVTFKYRVNNQLYECLDNICLDILPGERIFLIGQSGSGKSTLANLIMRFYDPQQGTIYLDGEDIKDINLKWLRSQFGYIGQEPEIFFGSIKSNLLISKREASLEELYNVLEQVYLLNIVQNLDLGIDSDVKNLSVGEKQRLCIARVLLRKPKIFIFDEPISSQDFKMEKQIQQLIDEITKNYTSIIISHSFSKIQQQDKIIIMNKGKILKQGKHSDLINEDGIYLNIIQERQYITEEIDYFLKQQIEEQMKKTLEFEEVESLNNQDIDSNHLNKFQEIKLSKSESVKKLDKQKKQLERLKSKIQYNIDKKFMNIDFAYQNNELPPENVLFNFGEHKTFSQFTNHQKKRRSTLIQSNNQVQLISNSVNQKDNCVVSSQGQVSKKSNSQEQKKAYLLDAQEIELQLISGQIDHKKIQQIESIQQQQNSVLRKEEIKASQDMNSDLKSQTSQLNVNDSKKRQDMYGNGKQWLINYQNQVKYNTLTIFKHILKEKVALKGMIWQTIGILMAIIHGAIYPFNCIIIADTIYNVSNYTLNPTLKNQNLIIQSLIKFIYTGITGLISATLMTYSLNVAGETLSFNLKKYIFRKTLHLPVQWFLKKQNKLGALNEMINVDTQKLSNLVSTKLSQQVQNASSVITALIVSYHFNYRLANIIAVIFPIIFIAGFFIKRNSSSDRQEKEITDHKANEFIQDAILNSKAIASMVYGHEYLQEQFALLYEEQQNMLKKKAKKQALLYAIAMFIIISSQSWFFLIASKIDFNKYNIKDLFICVLNILYAIFSIMGNLRYLSDFGSAQTSRKRIYQHLFKHKSEEQVHEEVKNAYLQIQKQNQQCQQNNMKNDAQNKENAQNGTNLQIKKEFSFKQQNYSNGNSQLGNIKLQNELTKNIDQKFQNQNEEEKEQKENQMMMSLESCVQLEQKTEQLDKASSLGNNNIKKCYFASKTSESNEYYEGGQVLIEFKQVYFKYPHRENYSLYNVSFQIRKGEKVSIIGASGSGKSTIFALLLGFFENYQGQIFINGQDIRMMDLEEIRRQTRWVQQEPFILQETLKENVILGSVWKQFNFKRFKQSLAVTCSEDIILKWKEQYFQELMYLKQQQLDSSMNNLLNKKNINNQQKRLSKLSKKIFFNEDDIKKRQQDDFVKSTMEYNLQELSGGQKQKICLSRAIYASGNIYLFDNATSQIDVRTEKQIFKNLKTKYFKDKTIFQISHRLQPLLYSTKLMIINSGQLLEFKNVVQKDNQKNVVLE